MRSSSAVLLLISFFFVKFARSQSHELLVQGQTGKLYLEHTVVAKENWYSVGRLYNITPKELTAFNKLTLGSPLAIGQQLEIPLTAVNFSQTGVKGPTETLVPVYHIIQEKEWMYRISVNHNKVPIPSLEKWNNVDKDHIHAGMHLIVGYLKVKTALSALAATSPAPAIAATETKAEEPAAAATENKAETKTDTKAETTGAKAVAGATGTKVVAGATEVKTGAGTTEAVAHPAGAKEVQETKQPAAPTPVAASAHNGGAFKGDFSESGKSASGQAGTFKSTSGWQDGKYYALMNSIPVGTIVRVNDPTTGKTIYAKVLGQLPDMKESAGLAIRISNAAAAELGEGEGRFIVEVKY